MFRRTIFVAGSVIFVLGLYLGTPLAQAYRLQGGTQVEFIVPLGTPITAGSEGDLVIFTGRSVGLINVEGCGFSPEGHIQSATIVDPGDNRATRLTNEIVLVLPIDTSAAAGTRVGNLSYVTSCDGPGGPAL